MDISSVGPDRIHHTLDDIKLGLEESADAGLQLQSAPDPEE